MIEKIRRIMAYLIMPLFFSVIGYLLVGVAAMPVYEIGYAAINIVLADSKPEFSNSLDSIYVDKKSADKEDEKTESESPEVATDTDNDAISIKNIELPGYGIHFGQLVCEQVNMEVPLYYGDDNDILREGAGQYSGSFFPGFKGTTLLAGHNTTYFLPLQYIMAGDVVTVSTNYAEFEYEITDTKVLKHTDKTSVDFSQRDEDTLVMYTCYPFYDIIGIKQERLFVYAKKISGPSIDEVYDAE